MTQKNLGFKLLLGLVVFLLLCSIGYIFKMNSEIETFQEKLAKNNSDKESIIKNLEALKITYDEAILEKTSLSDALIVERDKVVALIEDLKKSKADIQGLEVYRKQYFIFRKNMLMLITENETLKKQNSIFVHQRDSAKNVLVASKMTNKKLSGENFEMEKALEKGAKLSIVNPKVAAYRTKSSGKVVETDVAAKADLMKVSFTIAENQIAKSGKKQFYIQVLDNTNTVLGDKKVIDFGDRTLTYSFISNVSYENKTVEVSEFLIGKVFKKGDYFINIYDRSELVSQATFTLN